MDRIQQRVLVVDDYPDAAKTLAFLLKARGYEVATAASGQEALDVARAFQPTIIMLDIGLPDIDGYEVARRIRADAPRQPLRLIAVTGRSDIEDQQRAIDAGFDHHLTKPVRFALLEKLLAGGPACA